MPTRLDQLEKESAPPKMTPSDYPFPVFALCPPVYVDNKIKNNPTMDEYKSEKMDRDKFLAQWYNFYNVLAANSLVYLITPVRGLQDQTYVNSFAYLPHTKDTIILSNFTGEGRAGEELVAGDLLKDLGYKVVKCPHKFEGEPELKFLKENIYLGGYGFRSDIKAHKWLESEFGCKIIPIKETDEILYHLDCSVFVFDEYNVMLCAEIMERETVREIERIANVIPISRQDAYEGICNCVEVEDCVYNSSPLEFLRKSDEHYEAQKHKNDRLEAICRDLGQEIIYFDLSECEKSGAKLSCFVSRLNVVR